MPECFEKKVKRIRCLLKFYLLLINSNPELLKETTEALCEGKDPLINNQQEVVPKIKFLIEEVMN